MDCLKTDFEDAQERRYGWKVMLALVVSSIIIVYTLCALFETKDKVLQTWDFTKLELENAAWRFPADGLEKTNKGIAFVALGTAPVTGPRIDGLSLDTNEVGQVRMRIQFTDVATGETLRPSAELYWAGPQDIEAAKGKWPFNPQRGCSFNLLDRKRPDTFTAQAAKWKVWGNKQWDGTIQSIYIRFGVPATARQGCRVVVNRIELLEQTPTPSP